jgi:hypothetical protein
MVAIRQELTKVTKFEMANISTTCGSFRVNCTRVFVVEESSFVVSLPVLLCSDSASHRMITDARLRRLFHRLELTLKKVQITVLSLLLQL